MSDVFPVVIPGDPDAVGQLAGRFRLICDVMSSARGQVDAIKSDSASAQWYGAAAEAFRGKLGDLPGQLDKAVASYDEMAWCLWRYANMLRGLQTQLAPAQARWVQATSDLQTIQTQRAASANPSDPSWDQQLQAAQSEADSALAGAEGLHEQFQAAVSETTQAIDAASSKGIPPDSWWSSFTSLVGDISGVVVDIAKAVAAAAVGLVKKCIDLVPALIAFVEHPGWESLNRVLEDVSAVITIAALVIGVGALAGVAEGVLASAEGVVDVANVATTAAQAADDAGRGKLWPNMALDIVTLGASAVGSYTKLGMAEGKRGADGFLGTVGGDPASVAGWDANPYLSDGTYFARASTPSLSRWHDPTGSFVPTPSVATVSAARARYAQLSTIGTGAHWTGIGGDVAKSALDDSQSPMDRVGDIIVHLAPDAAGAAGGRLHGG